MREILVLYYSQAGKTKTLANYIARGINSIDGVQARIRTVPKVSMICEQIESPTPNSGDLYVENKDLVECIGLALGSPVRFGNMASSLKYFLDGTSNEWIMGSLVGKPATVFTASSSLHGGQESCLLSMMLPLFHHGMILLGVPYTSGHLLKTTAGGTPYGVSHVSGIENLNKINDCERELAILQGKYLATTALKLYGDM
ncbi:MAG: NAD(P)H:quinone oxidoreductase [Bacteroidia bacterium]|nr:MAG: NAD(P)H:quinone oxidoreductase [Bacteroidia bacterium]